MVPLFSAPSPPRRDAEGSRVHSMAFFGQEVFLLGALPTLCCYLFPPRLPCPFSPSTRIRGFAPRRVVLFLGQDQGPTPLGHPPSPLRRVSFLFFSLLFSTVPSVHFGSPLAALQDESNRSISKSFPAKDGRLLALFLPTRSFLSLATGLAPEERSASKCHLSCAPPVLAQRQFFPNCQSFPLCVRYLFFPPSTPFDDPGRTSLYQKLPIPLPMRDFIVRPRSPSHDTCSRAAQILLFFFWKISPLLNLLGKVFSLASGRQTF